MMSTTSKENYMKNRENKNLNREEKIELLNMLDCETLVLLSSKNYSFIVHNGRITGFSNDIKTS